MNGAGKKDYYQILGVMRTAELAEIAAAYRALARKHHPDTSQSDADSAVQFKLIHEAYEVLSDDHKRRAYDRSVRGSSSIPIISSSFHAARPAQATSFRWSRPAPATSAGRANDVRVELPITPEEARHGGMCKFVLTVPQSCNRCGGTGRHADATCSDCQGTGTIRRQRRIQISIPRGVTTGSILCLPLTQDEGRQPGGELLVTLKIRPCW